MSAVPSELHALPADQGFRFRRLIDVIPAAAYTCDAQGLITYFNAHAARVWGREPRLNDPVDRYCGSFKLYAPDGEAIRHDRCWMALALLENREYNGCELIVERPDGTLRTVLAHANPLRDETGRPMGAVNVLVDITDRKEAERALHAADRRKDEFLAILAHELRNPLAPLSNAIQLMRMSRDNSELREQSLGIMERQLKQMVRLVDDLMDISRISRNKLTLRKERLTLDVVLNDAIESNRPIIERFEHQLCVELPSQPVSVDADRTRLSQVFSNLLANAAKYMRRRGRIWISAQCEGDAVEVRVRDAGVGIAAEMLERIFEPFVQAPNTVERAQGGLGMGLSLAKSLTEMHGGRISARSDGPGQGAEFIVRLPVIVSRPWHEATAGVGPEPENQLKGRVLVVDDYEDSATTLAAMLSMSGYETRTAFDGLAAVEAAEAFIPDAALIDIGLPKMNGYEVARQIRQRPWGQRVTLIAVTGWGQDKDRQLSAEAGFDLHLVKPIDPVRIVKALAGLEGNR